MNTTSSVPVVADFTVTVITLDDRSVGESIIHTVSSLLASVVDTSVRLRVTLPVLSVALMSDSWLNRSRFTLVSKQASSDDSVSCL